MSEKLCELASQTTLVRAVVLREFRGSFIGYITHSREKKGIGQMVGSSVDGKWNETKAVSLMIKSAQTIRTLSAMEGVRSLAPTS